MNAGEMIAELLHDGFGGFTGTMAPQASEDNREIVHFVPPNCLSIIGSNDSDLNIAAGVRGPESRFMKGITRAGDRLVTVLDLVVVLATENTSASVS
jgi:hypothetical protein